ncbi:MAG: ribosome small subunit-dependent GTPase [Marmoricola sp.]|nr:ribosome small subunit-dependent GTPase [Marmoricola sp.]
MTDDRITRLDGWVGCVVACETGVARVLTDTGEVRASYSGRMLARIARDRECAAGAGDWVVLRRWSDDRVTIEDVWPRAPRMAQVISLHAR